MELGKKIRDMRNTLNLSQDELAKRCDLTKGYISQIENNLTSPSIATLIDILKALGTNLKDFFSEDSEEKIVFTKNDYVEEVEVGVKTVFLVPNAQKNEMEPIVVEISPHSQTKLDYPHEGQEFGYVLEGEVVVCYDSQKIKAKKGESFYFTTSKIHYLINTKDKVAKVIWVSSPPNF